MATEEEIKTLVEIEVAFSGIEPVDLPQPPTLFDIGIVQSEIAWQVGHRDGVLFANEADARTVAKMPMVKQVYEWEYGRSDYKWLEPVLDPTVTQVAFYKHEDVMRLSKTISENHAKREPYEAAKKSYEKFLRETSAIRARIWLAVSEARRKQGEIELARKTLARYVELTGDQAMAEKLLCDAYKAKLDVLKVVLGREPAPEGDAV